MTNNEVEIPFFRIEHEPEEERIYGSVAELIGWTPLVETKRIAAKEGALARIAVKLEGFQPGSNVKDRIALAMILEAERKGLLIPGVSTIVEPTSGNTGVSLAVVGLLRGYKVVAVMPHLYSIERRVLLRALGAELYITDPDIVSVLEICMELAGTLPNAVMLDQSQNPANPLAHYQSTGPEIWKDTAGKVDIFVAGVGTGGTLSGTGKYLKEQNPKVQIVAVEPLESPVLSGGKKGLHTIQGIGTGVIQPVTDTSIIDQVITVSTEEAYKHSTRLVKEEGMLVGISSGASFAAALKLAKDPKNKGKLIVTVMSSASERYMSTKLFASTRAECEGMKVSPRPSELSNPWKQVPATFQKFWDDGFAFPLVLSPAKPKTGGLEHMVTSIMIRQPWVEETLAKHGAILFRGFGLSTPQDFDRVVKAFGWQDFNYKNSGGMASRSRKTGRVLTVNEEFPVDRTIAFHNEAAYLEEWPTKVMFFCEEAPEPGTGGSTLIVGGSTVYQRLAKEHKDILEQFAEKGCKVSRCQDYETVAQQMDDAPARYSKVFGAVRKDQRGRTAWFNSIGAAISYNLPLVFGDGSAIPDGALDIFTRVMEEEQVEFAWEKGDLLLIDNTAVLHSRQACTTSASPRRILVSLATEYGASA